MTETAAEPVYAEKVVDVEKSLGAQPSSVDHVPNKIESKEPSLYDKDSSEREEDTAEKENKGGLKNYFVNGDRGHFYCIGLILQ